MIVLSTKNCLSERQKLLFLSNLLLLIFVSFLQLVFVKSHNLFLNQMKYKKCCVQSDVFKQIKRPLKRKTKNYYAYKFL